VRSPFAAFPQVLDRLGVAAVDGLLADLGVSSPQLDVPERGFSFRASGPLDMRMDPAQPLTAEQVVNAWPEEQIGEVIREFGEERHWRRVARAIVAGRPWSDTASLALAVGQVVGGRPGRIHPATRTFQGIRIAVNDELGQLQQLLEAAFDRLAPEGRLAIISFHSLEDRLVKQALAREAGRGVEKDAFGHPIRPPRLAALSDTPSSPDDPNPRARSARLRSARRLPWTAP
jgi:16S rRNA (cytosine1402-N4)-methyltransferase